LQQINANLSTALINSFDPRIAIGFLMLLCIWLYDDARCVEEFLEETAGIQTLVGSVAQAREGVFVTGLTAVLLGICVEFNSPASALPPYDPLQNSEAFRFLLKVCERAKLQKLIVSGVGGKDQIVFRITQFRETSEFRDFKEQVTFSSHGDDDLPDLWFDLGFVEFLKDNYSIYSLRRRRLIKGRIQRSLERSPESFDAKLSPHSFFVFWLMIDGITSSSAPVSDQSKYISSLEIRLKSSENDVKSKEAQIHSLEGEVRKLVPS